MTLADHLKFLRISVHAGPREIQKAYQRHSKKFIAPRLQMERLETKIRKPAKQGVLGWFRP